MLNKYKLIAFLFCLLISYKPVFSQCTITGQTNGKMIYAENGVDTTINGLSVTAIYIWADQSYDEIFQIKVPADTTIDYNSVPTYATINNLVLNSLGNLPTGSVHTCNPTCTFNGNSTGCVSISGNVAEMDTGQYKLILDITANVTISGVFPYAHPIIDSSYVLIVKPAPTPSGPFNVQQRLDTGETPLAIFNSDPLLMDSLYGKTYEGGLIFYLDTLTGYGFVAAEVDQSTGAPWGCSGDSVPGADGSIFGTGALNTLDIQLGCSALGIAAELCAELGMNGYYDWFLPNSNELLEMYTNLHALGYGGFDTTSNTLGEYWSSTEANNNYGRTRKFTTGGPYTRGKSNPLNVRACRYFGLPPVASLQSDSICAGEYALLNVYGSLDSLRWSSGDTSASITVMPVNDTTYYVSIYNGWAGRTDSLHVLVEPFLSVPSAISGTDSVCAGDTITYSITAIANADSYVWSVDSGHTLIGVLDSNSISVLWGGSALGSVCVYAVNNCDTSDTSCMMAYEKCLPTSINGEASFGDIEIYPNPFSESLNIEFKSHKNEPYSYRIFDLLGNLVRLQENIAVNKLSIHKEDLNNGVYFIEFKLGEKSIKRKVIVE